MWDINHGQWLLAGVCANGINSIAYDKAAASILLMATTKHFKLVADTYSHQGPERYKLLQSVQCGPKK